MSRLVYNYTIKITINKFTYAVKATPTIHIEGADHLAAAVVDVFIRHHASLGHINTPGQHAVELWPEVVAFDPKNKPSTAVIPAAEKAAVAAENVIVEIVRIEKRVVEVMEIQEALERAKEVVG